ncbi:MAG: stage 0 sporulation family protein [Nitrospirae bacterium]|nr:stage 0 sporulation family protein [Nitrospirota bacterium]
MVVEVRVQGEGKSVRYDPAGYDLRVGDRVIVEGERSVALGQVIRYVRMGGPPDGESLKQILRKADEDDLQHLEQVRRFEEEAFRVCKEKIREHGLPMRLTKTACSFDGNKATFYFTAEGRVDFRALVRDLAGRFKRRIEMRQIGVRDEAGLVGGHGPCGMTLCCASFLREFAPISIKMAKAQALTLNPGKLLGICGRLKCCLRYEYEGSAAKRGASDAERACSDCVCQMPAPDPSQGIPEGQA